MSRDVVGPFPGHEIALLQSFAAQAVIAIENARLVREQRASNRELARSLEQQTATADILRVISRSPTDAQPVFDAIVENARRLLGGFSAMATRLVDDALHLAALPMDSRAISPRATFPRSVRDDDSPPARAIREAGAPGHRGHRDRPEGPRPEVARLVSRSYVTVPLLREESLPGR